MDVILPILLFTYDHHIKSNLATPRHASQLLCLPYKFRTPELGISLNGDIPARLSLPSSPIPLAPLPAHLPYVSPLSVSVPPCLFVPYLSLAPPQSLYLFDPSPPSPSQELQPTSGLTTLHNYI
jgi:hypothetical protein